MRNDGRRGMGQAGEARTMSDEEAGAKRSLAGDRLPTPELMTMAGEPSEEHDDFADRALRRFRRH